MYTLGDWLGQDVPELWQGKVACLTEDCGRTLEAACFNSVSAFTFLLCGDSPRDLVLLLIDEEAAYTMPEFQYFVQAAFAIPHPSSFHLPTSTFQLLPLLRHHIQHPSPHQQETVTALCQLIGIEMLDAAEHPFTTRTMAVFTDFLRLLPQNYMQHRDLVFYADQLNITTTYLSRVVRQISGRTVADFIQQALLSEAARLLRTTRESISQIAAHLRFSDQAAFTKFFIRMKGMSPKQFRQRE